MTIFPTRVTGWVILGSWAILWIVWLAMAPRAKRTLEHGTERVRVIVPIVTLVALFVWHRLRATGSIAAPSSLWNYSLPLGIVADLVMLCGLVLALRSRFVLAGNWSASLVLKENHELIVRGPYRYVRHPIYSGLLLMVLATVVYTGSVAWMIGFVGSICFVLAESRLEEQLMLRTFPNDYSAYRRRVKALIPYLF